MVLDLGLVGLWRWTEPELGLGFNWALACLGSKFGLSRILKLGLARF